MNKGVFKNVLLQIQKEEQNQSLQSNSIKEAKEMITFLQNTIQNLKEKVLNNGFENEIEEINFFKIIKPQILGKLIYYNKVFRIETTCPVNEGKLYQRYYESQLKILKHEYEENICNKDFYQYYRAGRTDRDHIYFKLGQINYHDGLKSGVFEIDLSFSTYYDNKIARIIANELLYTYLITKISLEENPDMILMNKDSGKNISWTNSQSALIELIYALYASNSISHGNIGIRKLALIFQVLFRTPLNDIHHAFHRMKTRAGSRTAFLDQLKSSLEDYMDKDL